MCRKLILIQQPLRLDGKEVQIYNHQSFLFLMCILQGLYKFAFYLMNLASQGILTEGGGSVWLTALY